MSKLQEYINAAYNAVNKTPEAHELKPIMNPGPKSKKSLLSKVERKMNGKPDVTLRVQDFKDMCRCAVLFDSYKEIPQFLLFLKEEFPSLKGDISRNAAGYKGIHLTVMIDGVCAEIQLSTYKAWAVKDAGEAIYQATRDFNMAIENKKIADAEKQLQLMIENYEANPTPELKEAIETQQAHVQTLKLELFKKIQRNKELNTLSVEMFNELHSDGDFYSVEAEVEALLYSFTYTMQVEHQIPDSRLGKSFARGPDGFVDIAHAEHIIDEVLPISHAVQDSLIQKIEKSLLKNSENVASGNSKWIKYANLIIEYQKRYNIRILQSLSPEVFNSNIDLITRHREIMIEILVDFVSNNNIDITKIDDIIIMFNNEITMNPEQYPKLPQSIETLIANINEITTAESMSKQ